MRVGNQGDTVREALRLLREDHLVSSRKGAGTTVVPPRASDSYVHEVMSINDLVAFATGVRFRIDSIEMIIADAALAARIGASAGERWLAVRGLRHTDESEPPVCWTEVPERWTVLHRPRRRICNSP